MTAVSHSGERTRLAECMLLFAEAEGQRLICTRQDRKYKDESSSRRGRRDQHARRVRSPEVENYAICFARSRLATRSKRHLYAGDHFVELIVAKLRVRFAEIRPGVDVIEHQLDGITMNVVI